MPQYRTINNIKYIFQGEYTRHTYAEEAAMMLRAKGYRATVTGFGGNWELWRSVKKR